MTLTAWTENREAAHAVAIATVAMVAALVGPTWSGLCVLAVAGLLAMAARTGVPPGRRALVVRQTAIVAGVLFFLVALSVLPVPSGLAHPIWTESGTILQTVSPSMAVDRGTPFNSLGVLMAPFALFIATLMLVRTDDNLRLAWSTLVVIGLALTVPLLAWFVVFPPARGGFVGVFGDPVAAALAMSVLCFVAIGMTAYHRRRFQSAAALDYLNAASSGSRSHLRTARLFAAAGLVFALGVFATGARTGMVSFVGGLLSMVLIRGYLRANSRMMALAPMVAGIVITIGIATVFLLSLDQRDVLSQAATQRFCGLSATMAAVRDYFWLGSGLGTFERVLPAYWLAACSQWNPSDVAHSGYLEVPMTLGIGGVLVFAAAVLLLGRAFFQGLTERKRMQSVPIVCIGIMTALLLDTGLAFSVRHVGTSLMIAVVLACGAGISLARVK